MSDEQKSSTGVKILLVLVLLLVLGIAWKITTAALHLILNGIVVALVLGMVYLVYRVFHRD